MDLSIISSFKRLGAGSFATVFVSEDRGGVVVKQVKDPANAAKLEQEHKDLELLFSCCNKSDNLFQLPQPFGFYESYHAFAKDSDIPRTVDMGLPPHALYVMQRIWPVSNSISLQIRDKFFPEQFKEQQFAPFLARLYLGKETSRAASRFFNPENYPLDASRIEQLGLASDAIAQGMGQLLSGINFVAGRDGRDIKFVLCGHPHNPLSKRPWFSCIDFNQMREHHGDAEVIVSSIVSNDPYYPRPHSPYWLDFTSAYTRGATAVSRAALDLANAVLDKLLLHWSQDSSARATT